MLKSYDILVVSYKKNLRGKIYLMVLPATIAPLALHVPHHAE
jgi:hypothetical protein